MIEILKGISELFALILLYLLLRTCNWRLTRTRSCFAWIYEQFRNCVNLFHAFFCLSPV